MASRPRRLALVGPLPPPFGGMANQTRQLARLLEEEGLEVCVVRTNAPYRPRWIGRVRGVRALFRLLPYLASLWKAAGRCDLFHVMANSGWSWHLFAAPAVWIARMRGVPALVNYRGGEAEAFFRRSFPLVRPTLGRAAAVVVPSGFLRAVFERFGVQAEIVPNIIDLDRFQPPEDPRKPSSAPRVVVCRNLEPIYDNATAIRAFAVLRESFPEARLQVAGEGPERAALERLAESLGVASVVEFTGRLDVQEMVELYRSADLMLNASRVDNMPNALLEALSMGVPVVTTAAGGIPHIVNDGETALLVPVGDWRAMARAAVRLLRDPELYTRLSRNGRRHVQQYRWPQVGPRWMATYRRVMRDGKKGGKGA